MKKALLLLGIATITILPVGVGYAKDRPLAELNRELEALTQSLTAQVKLLAIYEDLGKAEEAARTRTRILDLTDSYRKLLDEVSARVGAAPRARIEIKASGDVKVKVPAARPSKLPAKPEGNERDLALEWLKAHQDPDGFWDCDGFEKMDRVTPVCDGQGSALYDSGVTGLALLAFLRAGETPEGPRYGETLRKGLAHLRRIQDPEGCFGPRTTAHFIYNHACAALAMVTAYAETGSPQYKESAQRAVDFVHHAQNPYLAWRYGVRPGDNDTSVTGWCVAVLAAAKGAGLETDPSGLDGAKAWIEKATEPEFGRVGYTTRGSGPARPQDLMDKFPADKSESLIAEGICIRLATGEDPAKSEMIQKGIHLLMAAPPVWDEASGAIDMYYWFWGTEAMAGVGGKSFDKWSRRALANVAGSQRKDGALRGSWDPIGPWGREGGRVYSTALMAMILTRIAD